MSTSTLPRTILTKVLGYENLKRFVGYFSKVMVGVGGLQVFLAMLIVTFDVIGIAVFKMSMQAVVELTCVLIGGAALSGLGYCQMKREHVRMDLVLNKVGPRGRRVMILVIDLFSIIFCGVLTWLLFDYAWYSWGMKESVVAAVEYPVYPARFALALGAGTMTLQLFFDIADDVMCLLSANHMK